MGKVSYILLAAHCQYIARCRLFFLNLSARGKRSNKECVVGFVTWSNRSTLRFDFSDDFKIVSWSGIPVSCKPSNWLKFFNFDVSLSLIHI